MENTPTQLFRHRIHKSNLDLHRSVAGPGLIGSRHSQLINRLISKAHDFKHSKQSTSKKEDLPGQIKTYKQKVENLERQQINLKKEMVRMSQISKINKNTRIAMEIKYESLMNQYKKKEVQESQYKQKINALMELNGYLLKITENSLRVLPHYENNCEALKGYIESIKIKLTPREQQQKSCIIIDDLSQKLNLFKNQVQVMQNYQKKMMDSITEAHLSSKTISQRLSVMSSINIEEFSNLKCEMSHFNSAVHQYYSNQQGSETSEERQNNLDIESRTCDYTFFPENGPRINKIFSDVSMLFQQHIHLLQSQKMEYQFTKNKKLISCQKFECEICENYQKIISQTFSIVREAFKEIKFNFLKEIKQISDVSEIPILI